MMITLKGAVLFKRFKGDPDIASRSGIQFDENEWAAIDLLISNLVLVENGYASEDIKFITRQSLGLLDKDASDFIVNLAKEENKYKQKNGRI